MASSSSEEHRPLNPDMIYRPVTPPSVSNRQQDDDPNGTLFTKFILQTVRWLRVLHITFILVLIIVGIQGSRGHGQAIFLIVTLFLTLFWNLFCFFYDKKKKRRSDDGRQCGLDCGPIKIIWSGFGSDGDGDEKKKPIIPITLVDLAFTGIAFSGIFMSLSWRVWVWECQVAMIALFSVSTAIGLTISICRNFKIFRSAKVLVYRDDDDDDDNYKYRIRLPKEQMRKHGEPISIVA